MKTITICASAAHFKEVVEIGKKLTDLGYRVYLPKTAELMQKTGNFQVADYKTWWKDAKDYDKKTALIREHFSKIDQGDAILVVNLEKNGVKGYIGGNTLMEMGLAFFLGKPIYIYQPLSENPANKEEIYALQPIFLQGNLNDLTLN